MIDSFTEYDHDLIGKVLQDRFEIVQGIGAGGMGAVYLGRQLSIDRDVAIKVLRRGLPDNALSRFMREARAVSEMSHPGIVQLIDFGTDDELCFIVMELVDGIPLDKLLSRGRLHPALSLILADQITSALAEAHAKGIIHRDLKPANILLTVNAGGEPQAKLLDFGIAYSETDPRLTQSGTLCGTPAYMAPEQAQGREVTPETDFYALGVNLYEMLSGLLPFYAREPLGVLLKHLQQKPPTLRAHVDAGVLPEAAVALTERLLKKEKKNRPATARDVRARIADALAAIGAKNFVLEGNARTAFDPYLLPVLTENPNKDAAQSSGVSFLGAKAGDTTAPEGVEVDLGKVVPRPDTTEAPTPGVPTLDHASAAVRQTPAPSGAEKGVDPRAQPQPDRDDAAARAWAAFAEAADAPVEARNPANIDPNLWSTSFEDSMASFSENSIEFSIPSSFFTIEPHDTTRERDRVGFVSQPPEPTPPRKIAAGKESRDAKRPDWLQSAQESMEFEIQKAERLKPNLPLEPEQLPELPPEETGETKFMSNILFILLTIAVVAGMSFIGIELFVRPVKKLDEPTENFDYSGVLQEDDEDGTSASAEGSADDPERKIGPRDPEAEAKEKRQKQEKKKADELRRERMKENLRSIDDVRYRKPIEIWESDGVKKSTEAIQDL
jgi:serine/threonine protein kinase